MNIQVIQYICKFLLHHLIHPQPFVGEETELKLTTQNPSSSKRLSWDVNACLSDFRHCDLSSEFCCYDVVQG